jgi:hypothetical protein
VLALPTKSGETTEDLTARLTDDEKWEKGRFVEFIFPNHGTRIGRVLQNFTRGQAKNRVRLGIFNPNTKMYNNRGGYRGYVVTVDKTCVLKFFGKSRSKKNGKGGEPCQPSEKSTGDASAAPSTTDAQPSTI